MKVKRAFNNFLQKTEINITNNNMTEITILNTTISELKENRLRKYTNRKKDTSNTFPLQYRPRKE